VGVLLYILLCGYPPFYAETNPDLYRLIAAGVYEFHATEWAGACVRGGAGAVARLSPIACCVTVTVSTDRLRCCCW